MQAPLQDIEDGEDRSYDLLQDEEVRDELRTAIAQPLVKNNRLMSIDFMRGFIMIVMCWDHTKDICALTRSGNGSEFWDGEFSSFENDFGPFFARFISDMCAPGFFLTMGFSMILFTKSRVDGQGWPWNKIVRHFLSRALVLLVVGRLVNPPFYVPDLLLLLTRNVTIEHRGTVYSKSNIDELVTSMFIGTFEVMTGLSLTLFFCTILLLFPIYKLHQRYAETSIFCISGGEILGWIVFISAFVLSNVVIVLAQGKSPRITPPEWPAANVRPTTFWGNLERFILIPGMLSSPFGAASYPVIPWIGITALGMGLGSALLKDTDAAHKRFLKIAWFFLFLFFIFRTFGGPVGNLRGWPRGDGGSQDSEKVKFLIEYLFVAKYPPSPTFAFFWLSIDLCLIYTFSLSVFHAETILTRVLGIFGSVPLFFYILHFWLIASIGTLLALSRGVYFRLPLGACVPLWLFVLAITYPLCKRYQAFKLSTSPDSWWRLL